MQGSSAAPVRRSLTADGCRIDDIRLAVLMLERVDLKQRIAVTRRCSWLDHGPYSRSAVSCP